MIKTIIGLILLLIPFLLIIKFKNKKLAFFYIFSFIISFHLILSILTQFFHIFTYGVLLGINIFVSLMILMTLNFRELIENIKKIKIDWILVIIIIILSIQLYSIHYNYTGKITTVTQPYKEVNNMKYPYPYFSDEWYAVSFIKYSIGSSSLPLANPLWHNVPFPNLELPFHSFVSEIILLLNLNPLTQYTILSFFSGLLICLLIYFILRFNKIDKLPSSIACLSIPLIVNGANLPGIWTLIPLIMGIISMLLGFLFMSLNKNKMIFLMAFLTLIFYPPLFIFYTISLFLYFIFSKISKKKKIKSIFLYLVLSVFVGIILLMFVFLVIPSIAGFSYILPQIFYTTFTKRAIPDFSILKVIPIPILILSAFGIFKIIKKKIWLIAPIFIGLAYWLLYSSVLWRFIIEYERVVVLTSILLTLTSGFGISYLIEYLRRFDFIKKYHILKILMSLILILFLISAFFYTQRNNWQELKLHPIDTDDIISPASPANNYLHPDDMELFKDIKQKNFLTIPWKGTVIGVATNNYPLETKDGTITNSALRFRDFIDADCKEKIKIAKEHGIDYIYLPKFNCEGFEFIGKSRENVHLYQVLKN
jgi:hypothetical protein